MADPPLALLLVEDDPGDARLVQLVLEEARLPLKRVSRAETLAEARAVITRDEVDVVLLDLRLPDSAGIATLQAIHETAPDLPVVVLTTLDDTDIGIDSLREGAQEFLPKAELDHRSLERAVRFARERKQRDQRAEFILQVVETLTTTLDCDAALSTLAHLAVPALADWCVIELADAPSGGLRVAEVVAADPLKQRRLASKLSTYAHGRPSGQHPVDEVLRSGTSRLWKIVDDACRHRMAYDPAHLRLLQELDPRSMLVVPLEAGGVVLGTLSLTTSESRRRYTEQDLAVAEEIGRHAAVAVANAQRLADTQQARLLAEDVAARAERMESVSHALAEAVTPQQVAAVAMTHGLEAVGATSGALLLLDPESGALELLQGYGLPAPLRAAWRRVAMDEPSPLVRAVRSRVPVAVPDATRAEAEFPELAPLLAEAGGRGLIAVPLVTETGALGVVVVLFDETNVVPRADEPVLMRCADRCAGALERALLFEREQRAKREARLATRARDDVLAIVAHDLRNPVCAVATYASLLHDGNLDPAQRTKAAVAILASTRQMEKLIQDLLDVSRLEAGQMEMEVSATPPAGLLRQALTLMQPLAEQKEVGLEVDAPDGLPPVRADGDRVLQVLSNLLGNAIKFTPRGGSIRLRAEPLQREVLFLVSDTGPGIPPEHQPHLFDRFWQARHARRGGAGLGLAIAKRIVELHDGRIGVESRPGLGSTFFFTIPVASDRGDETAAGAAPTAEVAHARAARPRRRTPVRIFVVDDHPVVRRGLRDQLERVEGYEVVGEAATGEEAVQLAQLLRPDLVLMDLALPGISGIEAMREITRQPGGIRVLAITAESGETALLPVLEAGGSGFVRKSTAHEDLIPAIDAALQDEVFLYPAGNRLLLRDFLVQRERSDAAGDETGAGALTETERRVVTLAAEGFTSGEIGKKLFLSPKTVDSYRSRAMRKLNLGSRAEMVRFAVRSGLLSTD